jgi:hypothetical protein
MKMEQIECSETSAYKIQTPGSHPEENIQHTTYDYQPAFIAVPSTESKLAIIHSWCVSMLAYVRSHILHKSTGYEEANQKTSTAIWTMCNCKKLCLSPKLSKCMGPTMAEMVSQQPVVTDTLGQSQVPSETCVGQIGTRTGIPLTDVVCPCQYDAISVPHSFTALSPALYHINNW